MEPFLIAKYLLSGSVSWSFAGTTVKVVNATRVYTGTFKYLLDIFVTRKPAEVQLKKTEEHCIIQFPVPVEKNGKLDKVNLDRHVGTLLEAVDSNPVVIPLDGLKQVSVKKLLKTFLEKVLSVLEDEAGFKTRKKYSIIFISKSDSLQDATKACDMMLQSKNGWQKKEEPIGITTTKNIGDMEDTASDKGSADEHQAQQAKMHEDGNKRNTDKQSSRNPADDHSSSFTSSEQHIRHRISVPLNISDKGLDFFLNGILTKYREKGFIFNIKDDCMVYDGPSELHGIFQTEFQSARSKISSIQTDSLVIEQHIVVDDVDSLEFENDGVFLEYVPENNVINFNGLHWSDIQRVKQKYQTRLCPQKIRVRGKRHFNQNHLNTNEHEDGDVNTLHKEDKFSWSSSTSDLVVYEAKGVTVKVYSADILHVPVDCIVNAANPQLNHQSDVAKVIAKAAGKKLRQDGEDYIKKRGNLKVGEACSTSAGKLPYHHVIHAVGPCWSWYKPHTEADIQQCENDLQVAIKNSLSEAERLGQSSIAIPAVSSGKFGCPEDFCAVQYAHAILDYVSTSSSPIKEIHFVDTNKDIVKVIHHAFRFMLPKGTHPRDYDRRKYIQTTSQPPPKKKDPTSQALVTKVVKSKLDEYQVDVIVNSVNSCLDLSYGTVSKALSVRAGSELQNEVNRLHPHKMDDWEILVTQGHGLKCKHVLHGVLPPANYQVQEKVQKLQEFTFSCLTKAAGLQCRSIAFPALGTGKLSYKPEDVAEAMFSAVDDFMVTYRGSSLEEVHFVLYFKDAKVIQSFEHQQKLRGPENISTEVRVDKVSIKVQLGTVASLRTDCVICLWEKEHLKSVKPANNMLLKCTGKDPVKDWPKTRTAIESAKDKVFYTVDERLKIGCIVHVQCKDAGNLAECYMRGLSMADKKKTKKVVVFFDQEHPVLMKHCSRLGQDLITAVTNFSQRLEHVREISLLVEGKNNFSQLKTFFTNFTQQASAAVGDQPPGRITVGKDYRVLVGYESCGSIRIDYRFQSGIQEDHHPNPGKWYEGIHRSGFLPDNREGNIVLEMLRIAFERKLVFTIGASRTTGQEGVITWNDIHHKTNPNPHGKFGYPDPTYLERVKDELSAKGITEKDIPEDKLKEINKRFKGHYK